MKVAIQDYEAGSNVPDPTAPDEFKREFSDKLANIVVRLQDMLQAGDAEIDMDEFYLCRGELLDELQDAEIIDWLRSMQLQNRVRFRKYRVQS